MPSTTTEVELLKKIKELNENDVLLMDSSFDYCHWNKSMSKRC